MSCMPENIRTNRWHDVLDGFALSYCSVGWCNHNAERTLVARIRCGESLHITADFTPMAYWRIILAYPSYKAVW